MKKTQFITFYSYKGGVGRTLALANIAWEAALRGKRVVIIDFDLEAPGIPSLIPFSDPIKGHLNDKKKKGGLFEFIQYFQKHQIAPSMLDFYATDPIIVNDFEDGGEIIIVPAGYEDFDYKDKLQSFNWDRFYENENGRDLFHNFRDTIEFQFDNPEMVLIDSRTGLTDIGGICTLLLPDKVVVLTGLNDQNINGCKSVIDTINEHSKYRIEENYLEAIDIILVASHVPETEEDTLRIERMEKAVEVLGRKIDVTFPYVPVLSLEERLLVQEHGRNKEYAGLMVKKYMELYSLIDSTLERPETYVDIHRDKREDQARDRLLKVMDSADTDPKSRAEAGETLGGLGDPRNLKAFVKIKGGEYDLEDIDIVPLEPFEIGKYPVTNAWFGEFMADGGYTNEDYWSPEGIKWLDYTKAKQPAFWDDRKWKCPNAPVVDVSWYEANAFTRWLTLTLDDGHQYRLLPEREWQAAAAGFEKRKYPWGNEWDKNRCNNGELKIEKTSPAGIFRQGDTPEGVCDLSGNVLEWTMSDYHSGKTLDDFEFDAEMQQLYDQGRWNKHFKKRREKGRQIPVLRGGSWFDGDDDCRCAYRGDSHPGDRDDVIGFRCART